MRSSRTCSHDSAYQLLKSALARFKLQLGLARWDATGHMILAAAARVRWKELVSLISPTLYFSNKSALASALSPT